MFRFNQWWWRYYAFEFAKAIGGLMLVIALLWLAGAVGLGLAEIIK